MEENKVTKINWFPGHMRKATNEIINKLKIVDLVIEVVDSRAINSSSNDELRKLFGNKKIIKIALKQDLADIRKNDDEDIIYGSLLDKNFKNKINRTLYNIMEEKMNKLKSKGMINPKFMVMVIGLPNVGKSSLINYMAPKKTLKVENRPGVTKAQQYRSINKNFNLLDTPGILDKKIRNIETGYKLALINCIKKEVLPIDEVLEWGYNYLTKYYYNAISKYYSYDEMYNYNEFINYLCKKYHYLMDNNELDVNRAIGTFYRDLINCKITRINYEND